MQFLIYGAKSLALGAYRAIQELYSTVPVNCFLVTSQQGNPTCLDGLPVREIEAFSSRNMERERSVFHILIAAPEDQHSGIIRTIEEFGFHHYTCLDSVKESKLMEQYFQKQGIFPSVHNLELGREQAKLCVYMARFHKDQPLKTSFKAPEWSHPIQVGAALTDIRITGLTDDIGENISTKNGNYCELTALYWLWKNRLMPDSGSSEYFGLSHYRRMLDLTEQDLFRLKAHDVDAVLPFPTLHEPDALEHHNRYIPESDWNAMLEALAERHPEYAGALPQIFAQPYLYNYNLILAKKQVLADYCAWLFPILEQTEELSVPKGLQRADRYIGYLGENLMTLYFMFHRKDLNIYHTGRLMLT